MMRSTVDYWTNIYFLSYLKFEKCQNFIAQTMLILPACMFYRCEHHYGNFLTKNVRSEIDSHKYKTNCRQDKI